MRLTVAVALLLGLVAQAHATAAVTLRYQADNRWVAAADNAPLRILMKAVRNGTRTFVFRLPAAKRTLQEQRIEVVRSLLQREAEKHPTAKGIVLEEADGPSPTANTLWIQGVD